MVGGYSAADKDMVCALNPLIGQYLAHQSAKAPLDTVADNGISGFFGDGISGAAIIYIIATRMDKQNERRADPTPTAIRF